MLTEMDGFEDNKGIVVLAATNRPSVLDDALTRPGRFDRVLHLPFPGVEGREQILKASPTCALLPRCAGWGCRCGCFDSKVEVVVVVDVELLMRRGQDRINS